MADKEQGSEPSEAEATEADVNKADVNKAETPAEDATVDVDFGDVQVSDNVEETKKDIDAIMDIPVTISAVLGNSEMQVNQLLKLGRGAVIELDRKVGEAIDIYVNNRLVARGEVFVMENQHLGVTMTEIVKSSSRG